MAKVRRFRRAHPSIVFGLVLVLVLVLGSAAYGAIKVLGDTTPTSGVYFGVPDAPALTPANAERDPVPHRCRPLAGHLRGGRDAGRSASHTATGTTQGIAGDILIDTATPAPTGWATSSSTCSSSPPTSRSATSACATTSSNPTTTRWPRSRTTSHRRAARADRRRHRLRGHPRRATSRSRRPPCPPRIDGHGTRRGRRAHAEGQHHGVAVGLRRRPHQHGGLGQRRGTRRR